MDRSDILLIGLGGAGGCLVDSIVTKNPMFECLFINTSITDIESLNNANEYTENFYCISKKNGVGRNREVGKAFAKQRGLNILDTINKYTQNTIYLVSSLGGGSGSSILSVITEGIDKIGSDFNKKINVICILPALDSSNIILNNTIDTWNEVMNRKCINSMIFIDNNNINNSSNINSSESDINDSFSELFDSIFDIPVDNGTNFDEGNLGNILNDKGCLYIYDLNGYSNIEEAIKNKDVNSTMAKMYVNNINTEVLNHENVAIKCGYIGISFNNENYNKSYIYKNYLPDSRKEVYIGDNSYENDILLLSGMLPPMDAIGLIEHELKTRKENVDKGIDFSNFSSNNVSVAKENKVENKLKKKKKLPKNLFS